MPYTAIGIFQGDADWEVQVQVPGFETEELAGNYANMFSIKLIDGKLYQYIDQKESPGAPELIEVSDGQAKLSRLKPEVRARINQAHLEYQEAGLDAAMASIKEFDATGKSALVIDEDDFDAVLLPIDQWHLEPGLSTSFESLAYSVEHVPD